jgi:hypothetical protein
MAKHMRKLFHAKPMPELAFPAWELHGAGKPSSPGAGNIPLRVMQ